MKSITIKTVLKGYKGEPYTITTKVSYNIFKDAVSCSFPYQTQSFACQGNWRDSSITFKREEFSVEKLKEAVKKFITKENS